MKINFVEKFPSKMMVSHINLKQLEKKNGGLAEDLVGGFWPPHIPSE